MSSVSYTHLTPKKVKLTANSAEKEYDGNPISDSGYSVSDGGFVKGEEFDIRVTGEQTFVGESSNTITAVTPKGNACLLYTSIVKDV